MLIYRLGSGRYPPNDGLGASLYGGRWNHFLTSESFQFNDRLRRAWLKR